MRYSCDILVSRSLGTKPLVEGAILAAGAVILVLMGFYIPVLGPFLTFFWPVPIMLVFYRHGWRAASLTVVVAGLVLTAFVGIIKGFTVTLTLGSVGLILGWAFRSRKGPTITIGAAALAILITFLITTALFTTFMGINLIADMKVALEDAYRMAGEMEQTYPGGVEAGLSTEEMLDFLIKLIPAAMLMAVTINAAINYQVGSMVLKRLGYAVPGLPSFVEWRLPIYTLYGYIFGIVITWIGTENETLMTLGNNIIYFFSMLFMVQGISLLYFLLRRANVSKSLSIMLIIIGFFMPFGAQLIIWAGMFEMVFNWRFRLESPPDTKEE